MFKFFCSELLIGALAQLGSDIKEVCPLIKDREDEEKLLEHFQFVLGREDRGGRVTKLQLLDHDDLVLPLVEKDSVLVIVLKSSSTCSSNIGSTGDARKISTGKMANGLLLMTA